MPDANRAWEELRYQFRVMEMGVTPALPISTFVGLLAPGFTINSSSTLAQILAAESVYAASYARPIKGRLVSAIALSPAHTITSIGHNLANNTPIFFATTSLFSPLTLQTTYFVRNPTADTFQVALTPNGTPINLTGSLTNPTVIRVDSVFDATDKREEANGDRTRINVSGGNLTYQGWFSIRGASAQPFVTVSNINISTDEVLTSTVHNYSTGQEVLLTTDAGGTAPTTNPAITLASTILFARAATTSSVTLHPTALDATNNTARIDISNAGSGTMRLRNARGILGEFDYFASSVTVNSGSGFWLDSNAGLCSNPTAVGI